MLTDRLASLQALLAPALAERLTLLLNHVLSSESAATSRLRAHAGRAISIAWSGLPSWLPLAPELAFRVTPAGLLEWQADGQRAGAADLALSVDLSSPRHLAERWLNGSRPPVTLQGDATFASDVSWLMDHLRWDIEDDLERIAGPTVAQALARTGSFLATGLRHRLRTLASLRGQ